jgi:Ca2+-transporting ATPase
MKSWWHLPIAETAAALRTDLDAGLDPAEVAVRRERYGPNRLTEQKPRGPLKIFFEQFGDFMIWVLFGAALVSGFLKEWVDAVAIIAIIILNAVLGLVQEYRAERSLLALKRMAAPSSRIVRGGERMTVASGDLVPGDLVELEAGDNIPADGRIVWHTPNFAVQEASLTGESTPVAKTTGALDGQSEVPLAERANIVYLGTSVVAGKARAVVVETGMRTELGRIAGMIQSIGQDTTPLQRRLERFGKVIVTVCFALVLVVFGLELLRGGNVLEMFLTAVSLAVAAIPEGLPAVVTIALALGVQRMVRRNAIVRRLPAVETLGCATVICSDKTGTLTRNEMTVRVVAVRSGRYDVSGTGYGPDGRFSRAGETVDPAGQPDLLEALRIAALCNDADLVLKDGAYRIVGDPTEGALLSAAAKAGLRKAELAARFPMVEEIPFDSERKRMTIIRSDGAGGPEIAFVKGAPDVLLGRCTLILDGGTSRPITAKDLAEIAETNGHLSDQALRVLGVATRTFTDPPRDFDADTIESGLTFVGLVAMIDPPRDEVREAIAKCRTAGIRTVMITGDHKNTAVAIARELGFFEAGLEAMTGEELDRLDDEAFAERVGRTVVYARVSPEHKLRVVRAWRKRGEIVAMTGDGVNDAPAVKESDIGVAMGITGTDVTKEVSDMIVTDDNFASIVSAVEEGRGITTNIKKFIHYLLSCNIGEILTMFVASLVGWPVPLFPIQILWVNLVTDGLPALALGMDPVEKNIMRRPPRHPNEPVIGRGQSRLLLLQGAFIGLCALGAFAFVLFVEGEDIGRARTAALFALTCSQLFHALNCRSLDVSLFKLGLFTNGRLLVASGASLALQIVIMYIPFTQRVFKVVPLGPLDLLAVIVASSLPLWAMEIAKAVHRRRRFLPAY